MFFDVKKKKINTREWLLELAVKQNGLFRSGQGAESGELEALREKIREANRRNGSPSGIFWWDLPWEKVYRRLRFDTVLPEGESEHNWEWEYALKQEEKDGIFFLFLEEHGRKYGVTVLQDDWEHNKDSAYSESEQRQMAKDYNRRINDYEFFTALTMEGPVYSSLSDRTYDSMASYYMSLEHWMIRDHFNDKYKRSLYTNRWTHHLSAESANIHCRRLYGVAGYHLEDGVLDFLKPEQYVLVAKSGSQPRAEEEPLAGMDAVVMCANYLADLEQVRSVPMELLGKDITRGAGTYEEAMRQAELFTCLARKMV